MTYEEKLIRAKLYADKLASGIDPISNNAAPLDSIINQPRLSRYFSFISEVLKEKIFSESHVNPLPSQKSQFSISKEAISSIVLSDEPIPISNLARRIWVKSEPGCKHFSHRWATDWLITQGYLYLHEDSKKRIPTTSGTKLGIFQELRPSAYGNLLVTLYRKEAQQYILDHIVDILALKGIYINL